MRHFPARSRKSRDRTEAYLEYAAHAIPQIDAEIAEKGHFWMETLGHARLYGLLKGPSVNRRNRDTRPFFHLNGLYRTTRGTHPAPDTPVQIHPRQVFFTHGQGFHGTSLDAGLASRTKLPIPNGLKPGINGQTRLRM